MSTVAVTMNAQFTQPDFATDPVTLAKRLIGQRLVRLDPDSGERCAGVIVETEAYLGVEDLAAHSANGKRTTRNEPMYGTPGTFYVYFTYGMHHCANVVCGARDEPVAVLLRALEPIEGLERMRSRRALGGRGRRRSSGAARPLRDRDLCSGPAKLCEALAIDRDLTGVDLTDPRSAVWIEWVRRKPFSDGQLANTPRIGVDYAGAWADKPLRWMLNGCDHVSNRQRSANRPLAQRLSRA